MSDGYQARISRAAPGCIIFLLDVSASMDDAFEHGMRRIDFLTDAVNRTLLEVAAGCKFQDGTRHYFDIGVLSYSGAPLKSALSGSLASRTLVPITDMEAHPLRVEQRKRKEPDGAGGLVEVSVPFVVWLEPKTEGGTSMCGALERAGQIVSTWCESHAASFPPIVLHITDGEATDGVPDQVVAAARRITDQRTRDGYAILMNLHVAGGAAPVRFPHSAEQLPPHPFARALFNASTTLPPPLLARGFQSGLPVQAGSRGYVYNGGMEEVLAFLDIGTQAAMQLAVAPNR